MTVTAEHVRRKVDKPTQAVGLAVCNKCGGRGGWEGWPGFTCYRCYGKGVDPTEKTWVFPPEWTDEQVDGFYADREAKAAARRAKRDAKRAVETAATFAANLAKCPALDVDQDSIEGFALSIWRKAHRYELTERQRDAYVKALADAADRAAEEAARQPAPAGRTTVVGKIVSRKSQEGQWGTTPKIVVATEPGWRVYVTCPDAIWQAEVGDTVQFDATLTPSDDDPTFAFGKRPSKATIVAEGSE